MQLSFASSTEKYITLMRFINNHQSSLATISGNNFVGVLLNTEKNALFYPASIISTLF